MVETRQFIDEYAWAAAAIREAKEAAEKAPDPMRIDLLSAIGQVEQEMRDTLSRATRFADNHARRLRQIATAAARTPGEG